MISFIIRRIRHVRARRHQTSTAATLRDHAVVRGVRGAGQSVARFGGRVGSSLPRLLVSTLRLCARFGTFSTRCSRSHTRVFRPSLGPGLAPRCASRERPISHVPHGRSKTLPRQRMASCLTPEAGGAGRHHFRWTLLKPSIVFPANPPWPPTKFMNDAGR
jgi:hypothetical protein